MTRLLPPTLVAGLATGLLSAQAGCVATDADESVAEVQLESESGGTFEGYLAYGETASGVVGAPDPYDYAFLEADAGDEVFFDAASRYGDDLVLIVYRWNGTGWSQISVNDDCYAGTLDACLTLSSDDDETYAALVTSYAYAYRGIAAYARYDLTASCFGCDSSRPGVPEGGVCGGIGSLECAQGLVCDRSQNDPGCFPDSTGICAVYEANRFCTREYAPVCGCDGRTYNNDCERRGSYVALLRAGRC